MSMGEKDGCEGGGVGEGDWSPYVTFCVYLVREKSGNFAH